MILSEESHSRFGSLPRGTVGLPFTRGMQSYARRWRDAAARGAAVSREAMTCTARWRASVRSIVLMRYVG